MTYQIAATAVTRLIPFTNTVATAKSNATFCGANIFSFSLTKTWLTFSGNTISVSTSDLADAGTYTLTVTVSLADYPPPVPASLSKTFTISICDLVQTVSFLTSPVSTTFRVGIDTQKDIYFSTTQTPACGKTVTFTLSPT